VIKWPEFNLNPKEEGLKYVLINDFSESEDSDDEREEIYSNASRLGNFASTYDWDITQDDNDNLSDAVSKFEQDYVQYHEHQNLKLYRTRIHDIRDLVERCIINGPATFAPIPADRGELMRGLLRQRLELRRNQSKQERENMRNRQTDPIHVPYPGLKDQYKAWTVTNDVSVDGNGMTLRRYYVPPYVNETTDPFGEYNWFGAEVVSPVLPTGDERAREAVRAACGSLRDALRCHKPMEVSSGLHIHLGHTKGWNLFQLKVGILESFILLLTQFGSNICLIGTLATLATPLKVGNPCHDGRSLTLDF
jgi:hypothetical protein